MNLKNLPNALQVILLVVVFIISNPANAQKVVVQKKVVIDKEANHPDSSIVIVKTIKMDKSGQNAQEMVVDSMIQMETLTMDSNRTQVVKVIAIHNSDTVKNESFTTNINAELPSELNSDNMGEIMLEYILNTGDEDDSMFEWTANYNSEMDPSNMETIEMEVIGEIEGMDSSMHPNFIFKDLEGGKQMVFIDKNSEEASDINGKKVFIYKNTIDENAESDMEVIKNMGGKKVIIRKSSMKLAELTDIEKNELNSKGIKTSSKEPEFAYLKIVPNPAKGSVNIEFKTLKPIDTEVKVTRLPGNIMYQEKYNDFSGEYKKLLDISRYGQGTYYLQIIQGKKNTTRKIVLE